MLAAGTSVGRYVIQRKLAEGGMAEIFLASAVGPEGFAKDVVIKKVRSFLASDSQFVQMFIAEARLASRLNHANVVQIFDFGKHDDSYYLAMEYVRGASLWDLRKRCRELQVPFPPTLAAEICAQVARGLQYAHALTDNGEKIGVVHRDVTPHNVLLSFDGAVKLTDFGIAKAQSSHTAPGMLKGKFAYMSPEQARGEKVDARTDIFALGIVLWELLTGGRLFEGESDLAVLRAVTESLIAPPARLNPDVPAELSDIVMKALARPVGERFQTAFDFDRALANYALRNAKSVEDTSVSNFLALMFKEELSPVKSSSRELATPAETLPPDDDFGLGSTYAKAPGQTLTATPTPMGPIPGAPGPLRPSKTEPAVAAANPARPKTEQMPALAKRPSSRRFDPIQVEDSSSVTLRPSLRLEALKTMPASAASAPTDLALNEPPAASDAATRDFERLAPASAPRSNTPLFVVLGMLVLGLVLGVGYMLTAGPRVEPTPSEPVEPPAVAKVEPPAPSEPEKTVAPEPAPVAVVEPPEVDAGPAVAMADPKPTTEPVKDAPAKPVVAAPRKVGTLAIKAVPFATVTVMGKTYEVTGVKNLTVTAGTFDVLLKHPRKQSKERVTVTPNGVTNLSFSAE